MSKSESTRSPVLSASQRGTDPASSSSRTSWLSLLLLLLLQIHCIGKPSQLHLDVLLSCLFHGLWEDEVRGRWILCSALSYCSSMCLGLWELEFTEPATAGDEPYIMSQFYWIAAGESRSCMRVLLVKRNSVHRLPLLYSLMSYQYWCSTAKGQGVFA